MKTMAFCLRNNLSCHPPWNLKISLSSKDMLILLISALMRFNNCDTDHSQEGMKSISFFVLFLYEDPQELTTFQPSKRLAYKHKGSSIVWI